MKIIQCDKCKREIGEASAYHPYSASKGQNIDLCRRCLDEYEKFMYKADEEFFKKGGKE